MKKPKYFEKNRLIRNTTAVISILVALLMLGSVVSASVSIGEQPYETPEEIEIIEETNPTILEVEPKSSPWRASPRAGLQKEYASVLDDRVGGTVIMTEGFEDGEMPPMYPNWTHIQTNTEKTWEIELYGAAEGIRWALCDWDNMYTGPQDEWLITHEIDLSVFTPGLHEVYLAFYWEMSYYWGVEVDTYDFMVHITTDDGGNWTTIFDDDSIGSFASYVWYDTDFGDPIDLTSYIGEQVKIAFQYSGFDGAELGIDGVEMWTFNITQHDVGVIDITEPTSGPAGAQFIPKAMIENFAPNDETNVPVNMKINRAEIEEWTQVFYSLPAHPGEWFRTNYGSQTYEPGGYGSYYASTWYTHPTGYLKGWDVGLFTPALDLSGLSYTYLRFWRNFQDFAGSGYMEINVYSGGTDPSNFETTLYSRTTDDYPRYGIFTSLYMSVSSYSDPSNIFIEFYYTDTDGGYVGNAWGFMIDDVQISDIGFYEGFEDPTFPPQTAGAQTLIYDQTVYANVDVGEQVEVTFPLWQVNEWHNISFENQFVYYVMDAETQLPTDEVPANDDMTEQIKLKFPPLHDIAVTLVKPESGIGGVQPVQMHLENNGQYPEYIDYVDIDITQIFPEDVSNEEGFEEFQMQTAEDEWTFSHDNWAIYNSYRAAGYGNAPELRFSWTPSGVDTFRAYPTDPINTSGMTDLTLNFRQYIDNYAYDGYKLEVQTSTDGGMTWTRAWTIKPNWNSPYGGEAVSVDLDSSHGVGNETFWFSFVFIGDSFNIDYWYIDNVELVDVTDALYYEEFYRPPTGFPPTGWTNTMVFDGAPSDPDPHVWQGAMADYSTTPHCDPFEGDSMAIFDTGLLYPQGTTARLATGAIAIPSGLPEYYLSFYLYLSNYGSYYTDRVDVEISPDGTTWTVMETISTYDSTNPGWTEQTIDITSYAGTTMYFGFLAHDGDAPYTGGYRDICLDAVRIVGGGTTAEYSEHFYADEIVLAGDEIDVDLSDWTPSQLSSGISGSFDYICVGSVDIPGDTVPGNNEETKVITLTFIHDVGFKEITSPTNPVDQDLLFEQIVHDPSASWSFATSDAGLGYKVHEDYWDLTAAVGEIHWWALCLTFSGGWLPGNIANQQVDISFYEAGAIPGAEVAYFADVDFTYATTGQQYAGFDAYYCEAKLPGAVGQAEGWVAIQSQSASGTDMVLWGSAQTGNGQSYQVGASPPMTTYDRAIRMYAGGLPGEEIFIPLGMIDFSADIENMGTFPETGITSMGELFEIVMGSPVLLDTYNVGPFDLGLGGVYGAAYGSYDFTHSGVYRMNLSIPYADDAPYNNEVVLKLLADGDAPTSAHTVDPASPGPNGWYAEAVTVSFTADDGTDPWSSGIDRIEYRIDGGTVMTGQSVTLSDSGEFDVEYRAVDNVGNAEDWNAVPTISIDTGDPLVDLTWEAGSAKGEIIFTATASDTVSGIDKVEFLIDDEVQFTATSSPYTWTMVHQAGTKYMVKAIAYDMAGNTAFDEISSGDGLVTVNVYTAPTPLIA